MGPLPLKLMLDKDFKPKPKLTFLELAANSGLPGCSIEVFKLIVKAGNFVPASGRIPTTEKPSWAQITKSIIGFDVSKERLDELWALRKSTEKKSSNFETVMELAVNLKNLEGAIDESELEHIKEVVEMHSEQIRVACLRMERPSMVGVRTASRGDLVDLVQARGMMPCMGPFDKRCHVALALDNKNASVGA